MKTIILVLMVCVAGLQLSCGKKATEESLLVPSNQFQEETESEKVEEIPLAQDSLQSESTSPAVTQ